MWYEEKYIDDIEQKEVKLATKLDFEEYSKIAIEAFKKHGESFKVGWFGESILNDTLDLSEIKTVKVDFERVKKGLPEPESFVSYIIETRLQQRDFETFVYELQQYNVSFTAEEVFDILYDLRLISFVKEEPYDSPDEYEIYQIPN